MKEADGKAPFRELDHTADICVEIYGKDEPDLFRNAVESLYLLLGLPEEAPEQGDISPVEDLEVSGRDSEEVLVELLGDLLYKATVDGLRFRAHEVSVRRRQTEPEGSRVLLSGSWKTLTDRDRKGLREIKAVTYHEIWIGRAGEGFSARVVMDI